MMSLRELCQVERLVPGVAGAECTALWSGPSSLALVKKNGVELLEFGRGIGKTRALQFTSSTLTAPAEAPTTQLFAPNYAKYCSTNLSAVALQVDSALWGHDEKLATDIARVIYMERSPDQLRCGDDSIIVVLTNHGHVTIHTRKRLVWDLAFDVSSVVFQHYETLWGIKKNTSIGGIRERCLDVQTSMLCWGAMRDPNGCYLVMAQRNGKIIILEVNCDVETDDLHVQLKQEWSSDIGEIRTMNWIPTAEGQFTLACSGSTGLIKLYSGKFDADDICLKNSNILWSYEDLMTINYVTWYLHDGNMVVIFAKNRHLLIYMVDSNNKVLLESIEKVNDYKIVGLTKSASDHLYVGTVNWSVFKLDISITDKIITQLTRVEIKDDYPNYQVQNMTSSNNNAFWMISAERKRSVRKRKLAVEIIFLCFDNFDPMDAILKNPNQSLSSVWDCIELLRLQCHKNRNSLKGKYDEIFSDSNLSDYHMKVYLILWTFYKNIQCMYGKRETTIFDSLHFDTIRDTILVRHAVLLIDALFRNYQDHGTLSAADNRIYRGSFIYVKNYCNKYKYDIATYVNNDCIDFAETVIGGDLHHQCNYCDESLDQFACSNGHPNQFCIVSFQQITDDDYLVCKVCGATACVEFYVDKPKCTLCDVYLDKFVYQAEFDNKINVEPFLCHTAERRSIV